MAAVYTQKFKFMFGDCHDEFRKELPFQDIATVMLSIGTIPIYIKCVPLTEHPYLGSSKKVASTRILSLKKIAEGLLEAETASGTQYRLIVEE